MRKLALAAVTALSACTPMSQPVQTTRGVTMESSLPAMRVFNAAPAQTPTRPNSEIMSDFLDLTFRMESGRPVPVMTRFEGPISVRVVGAASEQTVTDLRKLLTRFQTEAGIDIYLTGADNAAITVEAIPRAELQRTVPRAACFVVPRVSSWQEFLSVRRTPQVDWARLERRDRAAVFIPADVAPQEIRDCLHEELAQALGPLNDLYRLPDSVFNDDNMHAVLTSFDMLILRAYYSPELRNGMSRGEVAGRLPAMLARMNPAGQRSSGRPHNDSSRDWIQLIEKALMEGSSDAVRRQSAETALNLTRAFNWSGTRVGFANFVYGRLNVTANPQLALAAFSAADREYRASPETRVQTAHTAVQLAAFALSSGNFHQTLQITEEAIPTATLYENASLLATLMMFKAEALDHLGRQAEADAVRLDSLAWARYGFGSERNVRARLREVAQLAPN